MRIPVLRPLTPDQWRQQQTWQYRALHHLQDKDTATARLHRLVLLAMLRKVPKSQTRVVGKSFINKDGDWFCLMQRPGFNVLTGLAEVQEDSCRLGTVEEVRNMFRRLADEIKLDDKDRIAMFDELRKWVVRDARATSEEGRQDGKVFK